MRSNIRHAVSLGIVLLLAGPLVLSCAAPSELARRSESALAAGDSRGAWEWAQRAMRADPANARSRSAATAAAVPLVADWQRRVRGLAELDTVAAARLTLEFAAVRAQLGLWQIPFALDSSYRADEAQIRIGGAGILYAQGDSAMKQGLPRIAFYRFRSAREIEPGFRDVDQRERRSFDRALTRVAIVPFNDDTEVPGLAFDLAQRMRAQASIQLPEKNYPFVRVMSGEAIAAKMAPRELGHLTRDEAIRLGRDIGARRVVWGRLWALHSDTDTDTWHDRIYRKVANPDTSEPERVRWIEERFEAVTRRRSVTVNWRYEVIDVDDEATLASRDGRGVAEARTCWTTHQPQGAFDDYRLVPPHGSRGDSGGDEGVEHRWKDRFGSWTVPELLRTAHDSHTHARYRHEDLDRFDDASQAVFLDDLPPPEDLAWHAIRELWSPMVEALRSLEHD